MNKTKVSIWLEKDKPTRVQIASKKEFYVSDLTEILGNLKPLTEEDGNVVRQGKNARPATKRGS